MKPVGAHLYSYLSGVPFNTDPAAPPDGGKLQMIISWMAWLATGMCLLGLIATGAMLAVSYRRGTTEHVGRLGAVFAGCIVVASASSVVGAVI